MRHQHRKRLHLPHIPTEIERLPYLVLRNRALPLQVEYFVGTFTTLIAGFVFSSRGPQQNPFLKVKIL